MKLLIQLFVIFLIASTICICTLKPQMHKTVLVYNSDYKIIPEEDVLTQKKEMPVAEMPITPKIETVKKEVKTESVPKTQKVVQKTIQKPKIQTNPKTVTKVQQEKQAKQPVKTEVKTTVKQTEQKVIAKEEPKTVRTPVQVQTKTKPKVLTQQEEEIAWNVWRSNLQNQIMYDSKLPMLPNGTVFRFSFTVDKYGKITNIYTYSDNPTYTPYAIQYIAPVIRSYQGKAILHFPEGSTRISTEFKGGWRISANERLSTPQDYNDYEKVIKTNN